MTTRRWVARIFGYGVPIALILIFVIANEIHWPKQLLASSGFALGFTIMFLLIPLFITIVLDGEIPSKSDPSFPESPSNEQGQEG